MSSVRVTVEWPFGMVSMVYRELEVKSECQVGLEAINFHTL